MRGNAVVASSCSPNIIINTSKDPSQPLPVVVVDSDLISSTDYILFGDGRSVSDGDGDGAGVKGDSGKLNIPDGSCIETAKIAAANMQLPMTLSSSLKGEHVVVKDMDVYEEDDNNDDRDEASSSSCCHGLLCNTFTKQQQRGEQQRRRRRSSTILSFWLMGLLNNTSFVIMIAGAKNISDGGTAMVFVASILPTLIIKASAPFWFHLVSYKSRIIAAAVLMMMAFCTVAYFAHELDDIHHGNNSGNNGNGDGVGGDAGMSTTTTTPTSVEEKRDVSFELLGVLLMAIQAGLGESSMLALAGRYASPAAAAAATEATSSSLSSPPSPSPSNSPSDGNSDKHKKPSAAYLTAFSSGTGLAGVVGFAWVSCLHIWMGLSFSVTLLLANVLAIAYGGVFCVFLGEGPDHHHHLIHHHHHASNNDDDAAAGTTRDGNDRLLDDNPAAGPEVQSEVGGEGRRRTMIGDDTDVASGTKEEEGMELLPQRQRQDQPPSCCGGGGEQETLRIVPSSGGGGPSTLTTYNGIGACGGGDGANDDLGHHHGDDGASQLLPSLTNAHHSGEMVLSSSSSSPHFTTTTTSMAMTTLERMNVDEMSGWQQLRLVSSLWPYMIPLFLVYFAEYGLQSGTWTAIGFPVQDKEARDLFYQYSNWTYQIGVLLSRSSGTIYQASLKTLWILPLLQLFNLTFFYYTAQTHLWYNWYLLILCFGAGCLGGGVYVNAYTRMNVDLPSHHVEFALSSASVADCLGILLADVSGLFLQSCLYGANGVDGAVVRCPISTA